MLLCDHEYTILSLLRVVSPDEHTRFAVGERYNVEAARQFQPTTAERLCEVLETGIAAHGKDQLKKFLGARLDHPPALIEHCFRVAEFPPTAKVNALLRQGDGGSYVDEEKVKALAVMLQPGDDIIKKVLTGEDLHGYIILETAPAKAANEQADTNGEVFTDFSPVLYTQHGTAHREYPSFNRAVDEYFYAIESHKMESTQRKQDESASRRLAAVKQEQESRIEGLIATQATTVRKAQLVELNLEQVEQALLVIRSALAAGMDWVDLQKLIKEEQAQRNPVAMLIDGLKLETNQITLLLREPDYAAEFGFEDESDADDDGAVVAENGGVSNSRDRRSEVVKVDVDLSLSAYANARAYFDMKRSAVDKQQRTEKAVSKALKSTERQIKEEQAKTPAYAPPAITRMRKPFWFEKYHWFISTENHLVIGGRDAQQNEMLVKKYLRKGDVYIHADLPGSSSVIVKNPAGSPISPVTLSQAGTMAICHSRAWDAKIVTSAWWVYHDQVSKTAPTGIYMCVCVVLEVFDVNCDDLLAHNVPRRVFDHRKFHDSRYANENSPIYSHST